MKKTKKQKLAKAISTNDLKTITKEVNQIIEQRINERLDEHKSLLAKEIITEADADVDAQVSDQPTVTAKPEKLQGPVKISRYKLSPNKYEYRFSYAGKMYGVCFEAQDKSLSRFNSYFYVKGQEKSDKPASRFGISSVAMIQPVMTNVLRAIEQFLEIRKPNSVRFIPGPGVQFPSSFHMYIFKPLKNLELALGNAYAIVRGDALKDGSAFVVKKGQSQSNLKTQGWRPSQGPAKKETGETPTK